MPEPTTINREAGDKAKGPRLQRLRCVLLVFDAIAKSDKPKIYSAVEHKEDVFIKDIDRGVDYLEQNKNYDEDTNFTFNTHEVINTMVGFCDLWVEYVTKSKEVFLGFYSTTNYGKESRTGNVKKLDLELPEQPILQLLENKDFTCPRLIPTVKALILEEYRNQHKGKKNEGFIKVLEAYSDEDWKKFLLAIDWKFGELDEEATQKIALDKIKSCKYYNNTCIDHEDVILRNLMDLLDERQCVTDLLGKFVNTADVQLLFIRTGIATIKDKEDDPIYKIWRGLPEPTDKRSLIDKIQAVNPSPGHKKIGFYARKASGSRIMQDEKSNDKTFLSLRYRIYEKCEEELDNYLRNLKEGALASDIGVDTLFNHLYQVAKSHVSLIATDFKYTLTSDPVIEGIILELFDSCYLTMN